VSREALKFAGLRKRWLLNSLQLAVALRAWRRGEEHPARLLDHPQHAKYAESLLSLCSRALCASTDGLGQRALLAGESGVRSYSSQAIERVAAAREDKTTRILRRLRGGSSPGRTCDGRDVLVETLLGPLALLVGASSEGLAESERDAVGVLLSDLLFAVSGENLGHSTRDSWLNTPLTRESRTATRASMGHELEECEHALSGQFPLQVRGRALQPKMTARIVRTAQGLGAMGVARGANYGAEPRDVGRRAS
jgi:hypothetical protein